MSSKLKKRIRAALDNPSLRSALENLGKDYPPARELAYHGIDFDALREAVAGVKQTAIDDIENLANLFEQKVREQGGVFHRAKDGAEAVQVIKDIAAARFVGDAAKPGNNTTGHEQHSLLCVKSKSMTSEEIDLNKHLEGIMEVVETDLGEWIVQQVAERPSHIVMPAIHLTKEKCAEIFSNVLGYEVKAEIREMVNLARRILREKFLRAHIGISGCNIAVAETGTMVIFTNEGNGRLTASLPPVHIVLLGYEKLVRRFKDIAPIVCALPKSATAQVITSYITMISGPSETLDSAAGNSNGRAAGGGLKPKELHVILLDNGRLNMLKDPRFKEMGRCIRCASCLNGCPIYLLLSGQVYGHIYAGGIGSLLTSFLHSLEDAAGIEGLCINCGKCKTVCPAKLDVPAMILEMRSRIHQHIPLPLLQRLIAGKLVTSPWLFDVSLRVAGAVSPLAASTSKEGAAYIRNLPLGLQKMVEWRSLPVPAPLPLRDFCKEPRVGGQPGARGKLTVRKRARTRTRTRTSGKFSLALSQQQVAQPSRGKIALFAGCLVDYVYPETGVAMVKTLNAKGYEVVFPKQTCCGAPALFSGMPGAFVESARHNLPALAAGDFAYIVTPCPTCTLVLKKHWPEVLANGGNPELSRQAQEVAGKTLDFIKLLHILEKPASKGGEAVIPGQAAAGDSSRIRITVTYHDSCHLKRSSGVFTEPREIISGLPGVQLVEMDEADCCCGFGGTYSVKYPEVSKEMLARKIKHIQDSGAEVVVVDCPGCLLTLRGGLEAVRSPIRVLHSAGFIQNPGQK